MERILQKVWIIFCRLLYLNLKIFKESNSSSLIRFQCIVYDLRVLFSDSWNFYKLKMEDLFFGGNQFWRKSELFGPSLFGFKPLFLIVSGANWYFVEIVSFIFWAAFLINSFGLILLFLNFWNRLLLNNIFLNSLIFCSLCLTPMHFCMKHFDVKFIT